MYYQITADYPLVVDLFDVVENQAKRMVFDNFYSFRDYLNHRLIHKNFEAHRGSASKLQFFINSQVYLEVIFLKIGKFRDFEKFYQALVWNMTRCHDSSNAKGSGKKLKKRKIKDRKLKQALQSGQPSCDFLEVCYSVKIRPNSRINWKTDYF